MHYLIDHVSHYHYNQRVYLRPHLLRLRPRCNSWQTLATHTVDITPTPQGRSPILDLDGNNLEKVWFEEPTESFAIQATSRVATTVANPFDFLLEPWALQLPFDYPQSLAQKLAPYWQPYSFHADAVALQLAQDIAHSVNYQPLGFLTQLSQRIYETCTYQVREQGPPWPASLTWNRAQGSCRDLTVLFIEVCRAMRLASRFVSGYQEGDLSTEEWELHAWAEVYLPGAGWRGFDPTHNLAVGDRHIALVASARPEYCAPIVGEITPVHPFLATGLAMTTQLETRVKVALV